MGLWAAIKPTHAEGRGGRGGEPAYEQEDCVKRAPQRCREIQREAGGTHTPGLRTGWRCRLTATRCPWFPRLPSHPGASAVQSNVEKTHRAGLPFPVKESLPGKQKIYWFSLEITPAFEFLYM